jgi:hypothetical protein
MTEGSITFTIGGNKVSLTKREIEQAMKGVDPEPITKYSVHIGTQDYPIKQVISKATRLPSISFISTDAYRILTRLGFEVKIDK